MALNVKQQKILIEAKEKLRVMRQITKLDKEISTIEIKLDTKKRKLSELINRLNDRTDPDLFDSV
ncbi:MAG: hypothetical protein GQ531_01280 [Sulfurovum sp.]|nr:hypothetical protein [Sulfurovum sp.]